MEQRFGGAGGVRRHGSRHREDGDVAFRRATGAREVGHAVTDDRRVLVVVSAGVHPGRSVGAPLDHPEGHVCSGEGVAAGLGSHKRMTVDPEALVVPMNGLTNDAGSFT